MTSRPLLPPRSTCCSRKKAAFGPLVGDGSLRFAGHSPIADQPVQAQEVRMRLRRLPLRKVRAVSHDSVSSAPLVAAAAAAFHPLFKLVVRIPDDAPAMALPSAPKAASSSG